MNKRIRKKVARRQLEHPSAPKRKPALASTPSGLFQRNDLIVRWTNDGTIYEGDASDLCQFETGAPINWIQTTDSTSTTTRWHPTPWEQGVNAARWIQQQRVAELYAGTATNWTTLRPAPLTVQQLDVNDGRHRLYTARLLADEADEAVHLRFESVEALQKYNRRVSLRERHMAKSPQSHRGGFARSAGLGQLFAQVSESEVRALQLLRGMVSQEVFRRYLKHGFVTVTSKETDFTYQIWKRRAYRIRVLEKGTPIAWLCVHLQDYTMPETDEVVAKILMAELDEEGLWNRSNITPIKSPAPGQTAGDAELETRRDIILRAYEASEARLRGEHVGRVAINPTGLERLDLGTHRQEIRAAAGAGR
jgi:hypothetical protein